MSKKYRKNNGSGRASGGGGGGAGTRDRDAAADSTLAPTPPAGGPPPRETQRERWVKYGSNVALVTVVVLVLAVLVTYLAERAGASGVRLDTTATKVNSLKPQTINVIKGLEQPVKIVSLYTELTPEQRGQQADQTDYAGTVRDLLDEYKRNGNKIEVESIDPVANPTKVDGLIAEVTEKYGGEVSKYKEFLNKWPERFKAIRQLAVQQTAEVAQMEQGLGGGDGDGNIGLVVRSIVSQTESLEELQARIEPLLKQKPPNYKGATGAIRTRMQDLSDVLGQMVRAFERLPGMPKTQPATGPATQPDAAPDPAEAANVPPAIRRYIEQNLPQYREMKRLTDEILQQLGGLGELKLDELREKLRERDAILVLGPDEMRSLSRDDVWQIDPDVRQMLRAGGTADQIKPKFAGEQQITTALWSVAGPNKKKQKVVFVRPGGPPLAGGGSPFQRAGPFYRIAQRLRDYNFDVAEKDMSGMWAMQQQQRGMMMPPEPEPTDEEMKDAIWVALNVQQPMGMMPTQSGLAERLAAHLDGGGSAMVLAAPMAPDLAGALGKWGITINPSAIAVHEAVRPAGGQGAGTDVVEEIQRAPYIFVLNEYGNHLITRPMRSLDTILVENIALTTTSAPGASVAPLLTTPAGMKAWGETDIEKLREDTSAEFNAAPAGGGTGDVAGPVTLAAASERQGAGRLVVFGGLTWATNQALFFPDPELARKGYMVTRFPGNAELFTNSVFWLAKMDTMIAISPSAMEVNRIDDMGKGALGFWRVGVLLIGLPLLVVAAGTMMYFRRRD